MSAFAAFVVGVVLAAVVTAAVFSRRRRKTGPGSASLSTPPIVDQRQAPRLSPGRGLRASTLSAIRDPYHAIDRVEARERELADDLRGYLSDIAAQHGADDVMFWIRASAQTSFTAAAWNHADTPPASWGTERQRALVAWAAGEGVVSFDASEGAPTLAAARVPLDAIDVLGTAGEVAGALVMHAGKGLRDSRADFRLWLPRHAERLSQLVELQITRNEVARQNRRMRGLMRNVQDFESGVGQESLERRIAESMLEASGAAFAGLVRWDAALHRGSVRHVTGKYPPPHPPANAPVEPDSLVGGVCTDGTPRLWEDARALANSDPLYAKGMPMPEAGTLAILPLPRGTTTIGALVIGAGERGVIRPNDLRTARLVAQLAGSALEATWEIEEVSRHSRTDQLTGLGNRREFDEQLTRVLNETDRFGGNCALVVADVDLFKGVNDTYGHEAGDAVLRGIADVMRDLVRTTDICARIGGEELCVILPQTALGGAVELAERLRLRVEEMVVRWRAAEIRVTASFSVSTYAAGSSVARRGLLFEEADRALYRAKEQGRNCVRTVT